MGAVKVLVEVLALATFFGVASALYHEHSLSNFLAKYYMEDAEKPRPFLFFSMMLMMGMFCRLALKKTHSSLPCSFLMMVFGAVFGILSKHYDLVEHYTTLFRISPRWLLLTFVPTIFFKTALCMDAHVFTKSWLQIGLISVPGVIISATAMATVYDVFRDDWSWTATMLFSTLCTLVYPVDAIISSFHEIEHSVKHIAILMEGEALIGTCTVFIMFDITSGKLRNFIVEWHHFVLVISRLFGAVLVGCFSGYVCRRIIHHLYKDSVNVIIVTLIFSYLTHYVSQYILKCCSPLAVIFVGVMCSMERASMPADVEDTLMRFWETMSFIANIGLYMMAGGYGVELAYDYFSFKNLAVIPVIAVVMLAIRFCTFLVLAPILSRVGYGLNFTQMAVLVWSGIRGVITIYLALELQYMPQIVKNGIAAEMLILSFGLVVISYLVNVSTIHIMLRLLGLTEYSLAKKVNMNNRMNYILSRRLRTIAMLKKDAFLRDTNWPLVTTATAMVHPYTTNYNENLADDEELYLAMRYVTCPDCLKNVPTEPRARELAEMTREARLRILKAKKISYTKQYENGMLSKEAVRTLKQAVDIAMDTEALLIEIEGLHQLFQKHGFIYVLKNFLMKCLLNRGSETKPPRRPCRKLCHRIVTHVAFNIFIHVAVTLNVIPIFLEFLWPPRSKVSGYGISLTVFNTILYVIFATEFWMKILAYSRVHICRHGFRTYFSLCWNVFDFCVLIFATADIIVDYMNIIVKSFDISGSIAIMIMHSVRLFRIIRLITLLHLLVSCFPRVSSYFKPNVDSKFVFAYDVGKGYVTGEEEALDMLPYLVDNKTIIEDIKAHLEADRLTVTKDLGLIQKNRPWIAITVKTKQAIRSTLNTVRESIIELKIAGWVDETEYQYLMESLEDRLKILRAIRTVQPSSPNGIFAEVAWMAGDQETINFLYDRVTMRTYEPGDVICSDGLASQSIFIVVTGLFKLSYFPRDEVLEKLKKFGVLPVFDYLSTNRFEERFEDYIVSGNCIGELCALTGRPYNCMVVTDTHSQVYVLTHEVIREAMERNPDPINGLEARIWKSVCISLALEILMKVPFYQDKTQEKIRFILEVAFVPDLSYFKVFVVNEMIADIILVQGIAVDHNTKDVYVAPIYIPRTVQKLTLPKSSKLTGQTIVETKLLIIPAEDVNEYDIMEKGEEISEMVSTVSLRCLQHAAQRRLYKKRKQRYYRMGQRRLQQSSKSLKSAKSTARSIKSGDTMMSKYDETELQTINMFEGKKKLSNVSAASLEGEISISPFKEKRKYQRVGKDEESTRRKIDKTVSLVIKTSDSTVNEVEPGKSDSAEQEKKKKSSNN